eukprot:TRINITY_DN7189_c0_g1_i1.p1 TRINITY_DN7189_c0_g1~~TRINITY_DN7189_c0_g1_i1.p1  ORF type:complete len:375 (-),score=46.00 TRINITY_DN7189_c0_g1_i1:366-1412(-)
MALTKTMAVGHRIWDDEDQEETDTIVIKHLRSRYSQDDILKMIHGLGFPPECIEYFSLPARRRRQAKSTKDNHRGFCFVGFNRPNLAKLFQEKIASQGGFVTCGNSTTQVYVEEARIRRAFCADWPQPDLIVSTSMQEVSKLSLYDSTHDALAQSDSTHDASDHFDIEQAMHDLSEDDDSFTQPTIHQMHQRKVASDALLGSAPLRAHGFKQFGTELGEPSFRCLPPYETPASPLNLGRSGCAPTYETPAIIFGRSGFSPTYGTAASPPNLGRSGFSPTYETPAINLGRSGCSPTYGTAASPPNLGRSLGPFQNPMALSSWQHPRSQCDMRGTMLDFGGFICSEVYSL